MFGVGVGVAWCVGFTVKNQSVLYDSVLSTLKVHTLFFYSVGV